MKKIVYSTITADLFHYGHLRLLKFAKSQGDYHICGILSDNALNKWYGKFLTTYEERESVINDLKCVDETLPQHSIDPTENLKLIHKKYGKNSQIILVSSHQKFPLLPGENYIKQINGKIVKPTYYNRLSPDKIISYFKKEIDKLEKNNLTVKDLILGDIHKYGFEFTTKANTLNQFKNVFKNSMIEPLFVFTVSQWKKEKKNIINEIQKRFNTEIVIRSSALDEDGIIESKAGAYKSILNVKTHNTENLISAVRDVIKSYEIKGKLNSENQILVQSQTKNVKISGVIFTRDLQTNAPYYLINYDEDTNETDTVTSGGISKIVRIKRNIKLNNGLSKWKKLINAVKEIENLLPKMVLDIEFAIKSNNQIVIFQIRPLISNLKYKTMSDAAIDNEINECKRIYDYNAMKQVNISDEIYYSDMAFWNPAEIIGSRPNYFDYSLYQHLILNSAWNEALIPLGYSKVNDALMLQFCNKPYINLHHVFLCLTPATVPLIIKKKLIKYYNEKLKIHPYIHDKLEFELVFNAFFFETEKKLNQLKDYGFSSKEIKILKDSLFNLTNKLFNDYKKIYQSDLDFINRLETNRKRIIKSIKKNSSEKNLLYAVNELLDDCRELGVKPFTRNARLAFISTGFLKTAVSESIISEDEYLSFMNSIKTVAKEFDYDFNKLVSGKLNIKTFLSKYGHLRPDAYDITKPIYKNNPDYFNVINNLNNNTEISSEKLNAGDFESKKEIISNNVRLSDNASKSNIDLKLLSEKFESALKKVGFNIKGTDFITFLRTFIESREKMKFEFTKNLSYAIELLAQLGERFNYSREDISYLDIYSINLMLNTNSISDILELWDTLIQKRNEKKDLFSKIPLPAVILSKNDFEIVENLISKPNYITKQTIEAELVNLQGKKSNFKNKIILLEKADPGYDWIFTKKPAGLITKYGGAASHMAIRCAEFNLPAAIGVGETIFEKLLTKNKIILDCQKETIVYLF